MEMEEYLQYDIRNVQMTGGSSFMITLPKEWAVSAGLTTESKVMVKKNDDGSLTVYPPKYKE